VNFTGLTAVATLRNHKLVRRSPKQSRVGLISVWLWCCVVLLCLVEIPSSHHFVKLFKKQEPLSQSQVLSYGICYLVMMPTFVYTVGRVLKQQRNCFVCWHC